MVSGVSASLAGLQVAAKRIQVAADNLANQQATSTRVEGNGIDEPYKPQRVVVTNEGGVPVAKVETVPNPTQKVYVPDHPQADEYGFLKLPNVDQASELVDMKIASYDYKANLKAIKIQNDVEQSLLDIIT